MYMHSIRRSNKLSSSQIAVDGQCEACVHRARQICARYLDFEPVEIFSKIIIGYFITIMSRGRLRRPGSDKSRHEGSGGESIRKF